jgi:hypothetical protein
MTTTSYGKTSFNDANVDAFGRLRTSVPYSQFEGKFTYGVEEKLFDTVTTTGGTATFLPNESAWALATTTSSGSRTLRESSKYMQYHPGKSQQILMTGVFGPALSNCIKRMGYYDDNDGLFFEQNGTIGFGIVERTSTSGTPVDNIIYQSAWNADKLDGNGPSGITLDITKTNIYMIDFQWLGVGSVRYGVCINGQIIYVHYSYHANNIYTQVYMKSAWLPVRYEIVNTGTTSSAGSFKQICCSVSSEGGIEPKGILYSAYDSVSTTAGTSTWKPLMALKVQNTLNGVTFRGKVQLESVSILNTSTTPAQIALFDGGTLTGPSWVQTNTSSGVYYDTSSSAISGGTIRTTIYTNKASDSHVVSDDDWVCYAGDSIIVAAKGVGGNAVLYAAINWREIV